MANHNLPHLSTAFVGRVQDLAEMAQRLDNPDCRLLTVVGMGGMGKTWLAIAAAEQQFAAYPDGVYFVGLAPVSTPAAMVPSIASAIGFSFYSGGDPRPQLLSYLSDKHLLLVLDSFEHLLAGVGLIMDILQAAPKLKILVTSRERLDLQEETVHRLEGMSFPARDSVANPEEHTAVKLFVQSVRRLQPNFPLTADTLDEMGRICRQVQGMPLGIILAAGWIDVLSLREIAEEIEKGFAFLETTMRDMPERQRSLQAVFDHSWQLLSESGRSVFMKLSVFRGHFSREAAQQVAGATLKVLKALVDKSLLRWDASAERYSVHELLRQYGEAQLNAVPEGCEQAHSLHCAYYADFTDRQWPLLDLLREIGNEIDNILAAWQYAVQWCKPTEIRKIIGRLWYFLDLRNRHTEAVELLGNAAKTLESAVPTPEVELALGVVLAQEGWFHHGLGLLEQAKALILAGLVFLRKHDCPGEMALALSQLCLAYAYLEQGTEAEQADQEGIRFALSRPSETGDAYCNCMFVWAESMIVQGNAAEAKRRFVEALKVVEAMGDTWGMAACNLSLGSAHYELGEYAEAKWHAEQALHLNRELGQTSAIGMCYCLLGKVAAALQAHREAMRWYRQALDMLGRTDQYIHILDLLCNIGQSLAAQSKKAHAVEILTLIQHDPRSRPATRHQASALLAQLQAALLPETYAAAVKRGRILDLKTMIAEVQALLPGAQSEEYADTTDTPLDADQRWLEPLSARELEVLQRIAEGLSNREIAEQLVVGVRTVNKHINHIFSKLGVTSRMQAVLRAKALKLL